MRRPSTLAVAAVVLFLALGFGVMAWLSVATVSERHRRERESCQVRNEGRAAVRETFLDIIELTDPKRASPLTVQFEKNLLERLAPIKC